MAHSFKSSGKLSFPATGLLAPREGGGISTIGADLAMWFDTNQAYKSSGGGIVTPDSILTYTAPSPKLVYGADGLLGYAPHNLAWPSADFSGANWGLGGLTIETNQITAAGIPLDKLIEDTATSSHVVNQDRSVISGFVYTTSFVVKDGDRGFVQIAFSSGAFGAQAYANFNLTDGAIGTVGSSATASIESLGDGAYRIICSAPATSTTNGFPAQLYLITSGTSGRAQTYLGSGKFVYASRAQVNLGPTALTYVPTTTADKYSLPRDYNPTTGAALGVLVEEQQTNLCLYSDDFTNAAWVKSNLTAAKTATGPDGVANSASTLTATAANATALQAITSTSAARITSMFVKRRTGTGVIEMTQDNGSTWTAVTVTAGWTRVSIPSATAADPTVGIRVVTDTDAIDVALFDHELGAFITSPVATVASQVTRAADAISILTSAFPFSATAGTLVAEFNNINYTQTCGIAELRSATGNITLYRDTVQTRFRTNLANLNLTLGQFLTGGAFNKVASGFVTSDYVASVNGNAVQTNTGVGAVPTVDTLAVGGSSKYGGAGALNGHIKRLAYYASRKTDAQLQVLST